MSSLLITCYNGSLVTWTVVRLPAAKFKPFHMLRIYSFSCFCMTSDFCLHDFVRWTYFSQSHIATDHHSVSRSWRRAPSGDHDEMFVTLWLLRSCFRGAPSLTRGWVCLLYMLLALVSAVFLGSESLGTHHHILLSLILDFPFRRLLRLAGSRWKYSTPPPHGFEHICLYRCRYIASARIT
jgi:hypothetical protein